MASKENVKPSNQPKLTDEIRAFIVAQLAAFETPADVQAMVRKEYGVEITRQTVEGYNPTKAAGDRMAEKWRILFEKARKAYLEDTSDVPTASKTVRLRMLDRAAREASTKGNKVLMASLLEQIAKETEGTYAGRRELSGPNGKPVQFEHDVTAQGFDDLYRMATATRKGPEEAK